MSNNVTLNLMKSTVLLGLFTEYALRKYQHNTFDTNILEERSKLTEFVKKGLYGRLDIRVDWPNSLDKIMIENTECNQFDMYNICFVHFDFRKERPILNYVYKDSTLKMSLPDYFELEQ